MNTPAGRRGIGYATRSLAAAMLRFLPEHQLFFARKRGQNWEFTEGVVPTDIDAVWANAALWRPADAARFLSRAGIQLVYLLNPLLPDIEWPPIPPGVQVACQVHDLIPVIMPEQYLRRNSEREKADYHRRLSLVAHANLLLCDSEATARDVKRYLLPRGTVAVSYLPADQRFRPIPRDQASRTVSHHLGLKKPYVCTVNGWDYRKNNPGMIAGFAAAGLPEHHLVVAGVHDARVKATLNALARRHGIADRLLFAPFLATEVLNCLYCGADLTLFPSLYEGFGLPVLESLSCGVPVVAGNNSALPEVLGDAGLLVDAGDPQALGSAIRQIALDPNLRSQLAGKALQQAAQFTQERVAARIRSALLLPPAAPRPSAPSAVASVVTAVASAVTAVASAVAASPSDGAVPLPSLQARLEVTPVICRCLAGSPVSIRLQIRNTGAAIWRAAPGPDRVEVLADLLTSRGKHIESDFWRQPLPRDVPPGGTATIAVAFAAPRRPPGGHVLSIDLVHHTRGRFARLGSNPLIFRLVILYPNV